MIEQRGKLVEDPRNKPEILHAIERMTMEPDGYIKDLKVYLGLRSVYHRLVRTRRARGRNSVIKQLWHIALRIEDGSLSEAERNLRESRTSCRRRCATARRTKRSRRLMQELRQAMNEFMQELAAAGREQRRRMDPSSR